MRWGRLLHRNLQKDQRTASLYVFSKFTSNLTSQKQIVSKLEFPTLMGALLSGIQLPNCWHGNTLAVFHIFFFFQLKNFFPTESLNTLPNRLEEFWAHCLGKELCRMLGLFRENTFHHETHVSHWTKTKTLEKVITMEKDFEQIQWPSEVNREVQQLLMMSSV